MFVDDYIIFSRTIKKAARTIKDILQSYEKVCGQLVNYPKSKLQFSIGTDNGLKREITTSLKLIAVEALELISVAITFIRGSGK